MATARYGPEIICGNANFLAPDEDGLLFVLVSSSMPIKWQTAIGGRLESRLRFSNTLSWKTFPVPELDERTRQRLIDSGAQVIAARNQRPDQSLADQYDPLLMGANKPLRKAHDDLDRQVDRFFGTSHRFTTDKQRLETTLHCL